MYFTFTLMIIVGDFILGEINSAIFLQLYSQFHKFVHNYKILEACINFKKVYAYIH